MEKNNSKFVPKKFVPYTKEEEKDLRDWYVKDNYTMVEVVKLANDKYHNGYNIRSYRGLETYFRRRRIVKSEHSQYHKGVISARKKKIWYMKNQLGLSQSQIAEKLKMSLGTVKSTLSYFKNNTVLNELKDINKEMATNEDVLEQKTKDQLLSEIHLLEKQLDKERSVNGLIVEAVERQMVKLNPIIKTPTIIIRPGMHKPETAMLELSDLHIGEYLIKRDSANMEEYNYNIFLERLDKLTAGIMECVDIQRSKIPINTIDINMMGDIVTGEDIYLGQGRSLDLPLVNQVFDGSEAIAERLIVPLLKFFNKVRIHAVWGNHGRGFGKPGTVHQRTNFDYIVYRTLKTRFANNPQVEYYIAECPIMLFSLPESPDWTHLISHGDEVGSWMGLPFYGMQRAHGKYGQMLGMNINFWHTGHTHNGAKIDIPYGQQIKNGCFLPDQNIVLSNGTLKRIDAISENDKVINIKGEICNINKVIKRTHVGNIINMQVSGLPDRNKIQCTPNHEIYAIKGNQLSTRAENYHVCSRGNLRDDTKVNILPKWIPAEMLSIGDYVLIPKLEYNIKLANMFGKDFCKFLGLFLAEGSISGPKINNIRKLKQSEFTFHIKETHLSKFVCEMIKKYFQYDATESERVDRNTRSIVINNPDIVQDLYNLCGKGCTTKKISDELMVMPKDYKLELLIGWLLGDGCTSDTEGSFTIMGASTSKDLAWQMRQIAVDVGLSPKICMRMIPKHQPVYCVSFSNIDAYFLDQLMNKKFICPPEQEGLIDSFIFEGQRYAKIKNIYTTYYDGDVYDLSVVSNTKDGHSYIVYGVGVHNSFVGGSELSIYKMQTKSQPKQLLFGVNNVRGITWQYDIQLAPHTKLTKDTQGIYTPVYTTGQSIEDLYKKNK